MNPIAVSELEEMMGESSLRQYYDFGEHHGYEARGGKFILAVEIKKIKQGVPEDVTRRVADDFVDTLVLTAWGQYNTEDKFHEDVSDTKTIVEGDEEVANVSFKKGVVQIKTSRVDFRGYHVLDLFEAYGNMLKPSEE